jgi:hypothetical protein
LFSFDDEVGPVQGELLSLTRSDFLCYEYSMAKTLHFSSPCQKSNETSVAQKTFFDGTKLPLVVYPSFDHYRWYKVQLPTFFDPTNAA